MIHTFGDSHADACFRNIEGLEISTNEIGPITLKRVGIAEDELIPQKLKELGLQKGDYIIFVFGEIDVRCYVKPIVSHRKRITADSLLRKWAIDYVSRIDRLDLNEAKVIINGVVPPSKKEQADSLKWPVGGSDEERATYTKIINSHLKEETEKKKWGFLDIYSQYADERGMLPPQDSDGSVHIQDTTKVEKILKELLGRY